MPNNIAVSVTADVADLQVKRAILSQELKAANKDLNDFAKTARSVGTSDELRTGMLAAADSVARTKNQISSLDGQMRSLTATQAMATEATAADTVATEANTGAQISSRSARELLIMVHEAMTGNYKRLAGSAMIEAQAMAGAEKSAAAFRAVLSPMGAVIAGVAITLGAAVVATIRYESEQEQLAATTVGLGAASGLTAAQLENAAGQAAEWSGQSKRSSLESAEAFADAGVRSEQSIATLSSSVQTFATLTGEKAADAQKTLATAMQDPIKGSEELNAKLGILDSTQMEQIRTLTEAGDKDQAVAILVAALSQRINEANQAGVGLNGTFGSMTAGLSNLFDELGKVTQGFKDAAAAMLTFGASEGRGDWTGGRAKTAAADAAAKARREARLNRDSVAGAAVVADTPEARDHAAALKLLEDRANLQKALIADTQLHGANSDAVKKDAAAIADYNRAIDTYLPSAEKAHRIAAKDAQISEARRKHDKDRVESLTLQKALLGVAGEVMSPGQAARQAADAADKGGAATGGAATGGAKSHGPDVVSQWQQQLQQQEVASGEFFKDQTASELTFWQGKLALTKAGSKDWLDVSDKIYAAEKTIAHQSYQDQIADFNDKLESDRNNWAKEQADWDAKLAYIKGKYGDESSEYKNAWREQEAAQREHDDHMLQQTKRAIDEQIAARKHAMTAGEEQRSQGAQGASEVIRSNASSSLNPLAEGEAAAKIAQIDAQLAEQKINDLVEFHAYESSLLDKSISDAEAKYGADVARYQDLIDAKQKADEDYANSKAELEAQSQAKTIQNILAVKQAYAQSISGMVSTAATGFVQMAAGSGTWASTEKNLYDNMLGTIEQRLSGFVTNWIVQHLLMTTTERVQLATQTAAHVGSEVAKTGATVAGNVARVTSTVTATQTTAAISSAQNLKEITAHAAVAAAGAYRALASIPVVGPVLGAAAAAATFAAVEGFGVLASFAQGTNSLPNDMIAQVHAGERIVPRADNAKLLAAVDRGTGGGASRGDVHVTYAPQLTGDQPSFGQQLTNHASDLASMFRSMQRDGVFR